MLAKRVEEWTHEWKQEGMQKGKLEGKLEGESGILLRHIRLKFGKVDAKPLARVQSANADQLLIFPERIFSATTIDELLQV